MRLRRKITDARRQAERLAAVTKVKSSKMGEASVQEKDEVEKIGNWQSGKSEDVKYTVDIAQHFQSPRPTRQMRTTSSFRLDERSYFAWESTIFMQL